VKCHAIAEVQATLHFGCGAPDDFQVFNGGSIQVQGATGNDGAAGIVFAGLNVAEVDLLVGFEIRMQDDITKPALEEVIHFRGADNLNLIAVFGDQPDSAGLFRYQHSTVGQKFHGPGLIEFGDG